MNEENKDTSKLIIPGTAEDKVAKKLIIPGVVEGADVAEGNEKLKEFRLMKIPGGKHLEYGSFFDYPYFNFRDANIGPIVQFGTSELELEWLRKIVAKGTNCNAKYELSLHDIAERTLREETGFDLSRYDLYVGARGFSRGSLHDLLTKLVSPERPFVAYSSPNWIVFDGVMQNVGAVPNVFFAHNESSFVSGFEALANKDKTAALIAVDPANPLGYRLKKEDVERLETIAAKYGVKVIFDDVFRGLQEKGSRHSASEYSQNSIVTETTSKRFTEMGLGVTWTLIPKSLGIGKVNGLEVECKGCEGTAAMIMDAFYHCDFDTRVRNALLDRTRLFTRGFDDGLGEVEDKGVFFTGFMGMPVFCYSLPEGLASKELHQKLGYVGATSGFDWMCDFDERQKRKEITDMELGISASYMRICPTKESCERTYLGGCLIGSMINEELKRRGKNPATAKQNSNIDR